jgi:hypothetical protein
MLRLVLMVVAVGFALTMGEARAQYYKTGYTGADCTACGDMWPWSPACRWAPARLVQTGYYREGVGDKGSASCHPLESALPWSEDVSLEMGSRLMYQLKTGGWDDFGLDFTVSYTKTSSTSVTVKNSCLTAGCCLKPLKAFCRYSYFQCVRDREIARVWFFLEGSTVPVHTSWETCAGCSDKTKRFSVLCRFPAPELLPADQVIDTPVPYQPVLFTVDTYCKRK